MDIEANRGSFQEQLLESYGMVRINLSKQLTGVILLSLYIWTWSRILSLCFCSRL